jgi:hypothetical protein
MKSALLIALSLFAACKSKEAGFSSNTASKQSSAPEQPEGQQANPDEGAPPAPNGQPKIEDPKKCWFAVSGGYFGLGYETKFPGTLSGKDIAHNEAFDSTGGVFLNASNQPYLAPKGEYTESCSIAEGPRDIEDAVCRTFDSIAVAPGMKVEIKNGAGMVMLQETGPYVAVSTEWGKQVDHVAAFLKSQAAIMPPWMNKYLESINYQLIRKPLWDGRSVLVTKIAGTPCE